MQTLKTAAISTTIVGGILLMVIGYVGLLNRANAKIEARCAANGGQVLVTPGDISRCLQPAR